MVSLKNPRLREKKLIVFDLDGTLTETKSNLTPDMASVFKALLRKKKVAIIGGGRYEQFIRQFLGRFHSSPLLLNNLFLFPTTATACYRYRKGKWRRVYYENIPLKDRRAIKKAFRDVLRKIHYVPPKNVYGKTIEDRGTQVTLSFLGQDVVHILGEKKGVRLKKEWTRKNSSLKFKVARLVAKRLPHLGVYAAGYTSVDVTRKGIDKAYGIRKIRTTLKIPIKDMVFIGDALNPGGNDYAVRRTGVDWIAVKGPAETKKIMQALLKEKY